VKRRHPGEEVGEKWIDIGERFGTNEGSTSEAQSNFRGELAGLLWDIVNLIFGKPLKSSEERAEQIGPAEGIPIFGLDALSSAAYRAGSGIEPADSAGTAGRAVHRADQRGDYHAAGDCVFFVPADDRGRTRRAAGRTRWRGINLGSFLGITGSGGAAGRLHFDGGGGNFGGSGAR